MFIPFLSHPLFSVSERKKKKREWKHFNQLALIHFLIIQSFPFPGKKKDLFSCHIILHSKVFSENPLPVSCDQCVMLRPYMKMSNDLL